MISVPYGTGDIADAMISALQMIYASRMKGTDIISYLHRKYIIRQSRISYRDSDISLKQTVCIFGEYTQKRSTPFGVLLFCFLGALHQEPVIINLPFTD